MPKSVLCVSLHDVAPATLSQCRRLRQAIAATAKVPVTLLVSPAYHRGARSDPRFDAFLEQCLAAGDELALHGYVHLDEGAAPRGLRERFLREVFTQREGEFAALAESEARRRIDAGLAWFARRGWMPAGFVAPAWLLSEGSWRALRSAPFRYTTTLRHFHRLPRGGAEHAPGLVYCARHAMGRWLSCHWNDAQLRQYRSVPLLRLGLHPRDAASPEVLGHAHGLLEILLRERRAMTKADYAALAAEGRGIT